MVRRPLAPPVAPGLETLLRPVADLRLDPANARAHSDRNLQAIADSLARFGQQKPIVVSPDGTVLAGNGTLAAAQLLGWTHIAAITTDLEGADQRGYAIADNRTAELAEWDAIRLASELQALPPDVFATLGFDDKELQRIAHDAELAIRAMQDGEQDLDDVPEPPDAAITQPGDLWILGRHRLLCGDSGSPADLDRLLDGAPVHLVNTDPPYNVKVEPRSNNAIRAGLSSFTAPERRHHQALDLARHPEKSRPTHAKMRAKDRPLENDFVSDEEFERLLRAWFGNIARVLLPGRGFWIWGGYANCANYPPVLKSCGLYFSQSVIWVKEHPVLTRKDMMGNHEWAFYGWREGAAHHWFGPSNVPDVWSVKKVNPQAMVHLTEKPVELAVRAITYSSTPGEHVLDLFGGSGSTLVAAETTNRRAFLMELDPPYCDVIVQRFEKLTGTKAERIAGGSTS